MVEDAEPLLEFPPRHLRSRIVLPPASQTGPHCGLRHINFCAIVNTCMVLDMFDLHCPLSMEANIHFVYEDAYTCGETKRLLMLMLTRKEEKKKKKGGCMNMF